MKTKKPSFRQERLLWDKRVNYVIGMDEVGRGAFAGPIVAAGVVYSSSQNSKHLGNVNDSKLLNPILRTKCVKIIKENSLSWAVESVNISYINKHGIGKANTQAFRKVLKKLFSQMKNDLNHFVLIDGFHIKYLPGGLKKQKGIIKGDRICLSIASASILAKVYRDNLIKKLNKKYPQYNFYKNKGYGTKFHRDALKKHGLSKIHRTSFNLKKYL